jgi:glycosyltransferase involved in cell wall biosynthesis
MRIGIVVSPYKESAFGAEPFPCNGVAVYTRHLVAALVEVDSANEYYLIHCHRDALDIRTHPRLHPLVFPWPWLWRAAHHFGLWREWTVRRYQLDLVHEVIPNNCVWRPSPYRLALTLHDLTPLLLPQAFSTRSRLAFRLWLGHNVGRAQHIICVSENTRNDLLRFFPAAEQKSSVIAIAGQPLDGNGDLAPVLAHYGIRRPYLLCVATIEPRKNHVALFDALIELRRNGYRHQLVCVGGLGWKTREILSHPAIRSCRGDVVLTGVLDGGALGRLYRGAECFIYPTFYEGFGLPPLEALGAGVPVLASRNSSLPEVLGDAPVWLAARPTGAEIASAVIELAARPDLRRERIGRGLAQWRRFDWRGTAQQTLEVYERIVRGDATC